MDERAFECILLLLFKTTSEYTMSEDPRQPDYNVLSIASNYFLQRKPSLKQ